MTLRVVSRWSAARRPASPPRSSPSSGTTSRAAAVGVEARASAARSQSGVSCSCPTAETTGTEHAATARTTCSALKGRRSSKLPPPRARTITSISGSAASVSQRGGDERRGPRSLHGRLRDEDPRGREARPHRGHEVALGRGLGAGQQSDPAGEERQRALALLGEEPFRGKRLAQPLDPRGERAESDGLERERPQAERAAGRVELRPPEHLDARRRRRARSAARRTWSAASKPDRHEPSAGSLSVKNTLCQPGWRRNSVTSPSTQSVGRRASQSATPRLNAATA